MHFTGVEQETKLVHPSPKSGTCKLQIIPRGRYPTTGKNKRKPWDSTPYIGDTGFNRRTVCKEIVLPVPTPDFKCIPAKQIKRLSNGEVQEKDVLLCQENWKPAVWACGPQNFVHVRQCHKWGAGISKTDAAPLPNNYRILYCLRSGETKNAADHGHPAVCEIIEEEHVRIIDEADCPDAANAAAAAVFHDTSCCSRKPHGLQGCD